MPLDHNVDIVARTIWGEDRGGGETGMAAVACAIQNRAKIAEAYFTLHGKRHPLFGDGQLATACQMPSQFSCWDHNDPNMRGMMTVDEHDPAFVIAVHIATKAAGEQLYDAVNGATHYYAKSMPHPPYWAEGKTPVADVGGHLFFKGV